MPLIDIVTVNWNSGAFLRTCLTSLAAEPDADPLMTVTIVDNASTDDSLDGVTPSPRVRIIRNDGNRGFAAACNQGAREGSSPYILFLNPDTRITREALKATVRYMESPAAADVGICGIQLLDDSGAVSRSCSRLPTRGLFLSSAFGLDRLLPRWFPPHAMTEWNHLDTRAVDQVIGAYFFVRRSLFEELGGFDERFFVYFEEVDFSLRARALGWRTMYVATISGAHTGGGTTDRVKAFRQFLVTRSRMAYARKHWGSTFAAAYRLLALIVEPVVRSIHFAARRDGEAVRDSWRAVRMLLADARTGGSGRIRDP